MKKIIKDWLKTAIAGLLVLILGLILRLYRLTYLPIFADEAIYIRWSQVMRAEPTLRFLPLSDGKQPLFMWATIPFLKLFSDPLFAGRFLSVLVGLVTTIGIFFLTYLFFKSKKTALIASLIYVFSPFCLFFDRMALTDSMLSMFGVWSLFFGVLTSKTFRLDFAMITGFVLGGALLTKSPALFFSLMLPGSWIFIEWQKGVKNIFVKLIKLFGLFSVSYIIAYGMYNILRLGPNFQMIGTRNQDYIFPLSHLWTNPKDPFIFLIDRSFEWIRMMGPWPLIVIWLLSYLVSWKKYFKEALILTIWFLFPILVQSEFAKVFTARYILFSIPYLIILGSSVFLTGSNLVKKVSITILLLFFFLAMKFNYSLLTNIEEANLPRSERSGYLEEWTAGYGIKEAADFVRSEYQKEPNKKIVVGTEGFFGTLPDGLQIFLNDLPEVTIIGIGIDINQIPQSLVESKKAGNKTYLVINSSRFEIKKPGEFGLELIAAYPKAFRPEGFREYIRFGPRDNLYLFELKNIKTPFSKQKTS